MGFIMVFICLFYFVVGSHLSMEVGNKQCPKNKGYDRTEVRFLIIQLQFWTKWLKGNLSLNEIIVGQDDSLQKGY